MSAERLVCEVFKSSSREGMYLFVDKREGLEHVPDALLERFGEPVAIMTLLLTPERRLARASTKDVMDSIVDSGFYLQMPPGKDDHLLDRYRAPTEARY
ncbi:YcgL domain-containing protein [Aidingimonas halophila]|uniref:YcgL domain-containing protein SAMN05443545_107233 n=1 Tax=Aidingimonas halophila TaxID=574349 RepID=A0A1H3ESC1_9GAMM|nr:YcgL domain-containing protein [Aidingimonas halophila]GHC31639.1 YcgL domain-containing protein [Aidingimonas halophila]SDX81633.1 hypothetical protein SAMN05443545_107233 [Aidingimonas halophila]